MALGSKLDVEALHPALERWFAGKLADNHGLSLSNLRSPQGIGGSSETILVDLDWQDGRGRHNESLVIRLQPRDGMFRTYDLEAQFRVMEALHTRSIVPVPRPWAWEPDPDILGAPFAVMGFVAGRVPLDVPAYTQTGWVHELSEGERALLADNALRALVAIHAADHHALGLDFLDRQASGRDVIERRLNHWRIQLEWGAAGEANPIVEAALDWLDVHRPAGHVEEVLVWGDARVGNIIFADDLSVAAVLDWEMQTIGTREMDVCYWLWMQRYHTDAIGVPLPGGIPGREATIRRYEELSGYRLRDLLFYDVLSTVSSATLYHRLGHVMIANGALPPTSTIKTDNPATRVLAELLSLPEPA